LDNPHCPGLAWDVVGTWLGAADQGPPAERPRSLSDILSLLGSGPDAWQCQVHAQRRITVERDTRQPDLVLEFQRLEDGGVSEIKVCVEVKHGSGFDREQLDAYKKWLGNYSGLGVLLLVAPRADYGRFKRDEIPPEVPHLTWQQTAKTISRHSTADCAGRFLLEEFCDYLSEEGLMDPDFVSPLHLAALAERNRAERAVALACEMASGYLSQNWDKQLDVKKPRAAASYGIDYWEMHPAARKGESADDWHPAWWGWELKSSDAALPSSRGGIPVFIAGLTAERGDVIAAGEDGAVWLAKLNAPHQESGDGFFAISGDAEWLVRAAYPEEVLVGRTLEQQGETLGKWILGTYDALYKAHSPNRGNAP
jgi:hypothetical protein